MPDMTFTTTTAVKTVTLQPVWSQK